MRFFRIASCETALSSFHTPVGLSAETLRRAKQRIRTATSSCFHQTTIFLDLSEQQNSQHKD